MSLKKRAVYAAVVIALTSASIWVVQASTAGAASSPLVKFPTAKIYATEGNSGTSNVSVAVMLTVAQSSPVTASYATSDGSAKTSDNDYVAKSGTVTFPAKSTSQNITVQIKGDTKLEDYENFKVKLSNVVGAKLGTATENVWIMNDEKPGVNIPATRYTEGTTAVVKPKLTKRYYQNISATAQTLNGTAVAPGDYTAINESVTFPAGSTAPIDVDVPTATDSLAEGTETFSVQVSSPSLSGIGDGTVSLLDPPMCPVGTVPTNPPPSSPPSPSSPVTTGPPTAVTGGAQWDVMFSDDFDNPSYTASKWDTGMRAGALTLEGNHELEWYSPSNSVLTTDNDGTNNISVLQQKLTKTTTPGEYYTVRTLSGIYPPSECPQYYDSKHMNPTDLTKVPYAYQSGMLNNAKSFGFKYGYVEARFKMPKGFALWPALWLRNWGPWSYEIDAMEGFDRDSRVLKSTYWWGSGSHRSTSDDGGDLGLLSAGGTCLGNAPLPATTGTPGACSLANAVDFSQGYHTLGLLWTSTKYEIYIDGVKRWASQPGAKIDSAYNHLILDLAFGNDTYSFDWRGEPVKPLDPTLFDSSYFSKRSIEWDYVRVWQAANAHNICTTGSC